MASWMIHFRIAQSILDSTNNLFSDTATRTAFVLGNIAPDSGAPAPDGRGYIPGKDISHFMRCFEGVPAGHNRERCDPEAFVESYLTPRQNIPADPEARAFYLGYLCHLVTDNAWVRDMVYPAKEAFAAMRLEGGVETPAAVARFYAFLKKDWYDLDFLYIKHHPTLPAYRLFLEAPHLPNRYLPYFPALAFEEKREEIRAFYRQGAATVTERETYLPPEALANFTARVARETTDEFGHLFAPHSALV